MIKDLINEIKKEIERLLGYQPTIGKTYKEAIRTLSETISNGYPYGVILIGKTGVGKTVLMNAAVNVSNKHNKLPFEEIPAHKLKSVTNPETGFSSVLDFRMPLLSIDDIGQEELTVKHYGTEYHPFQDVIQYRYEMDDKVKCLLGTTNLTPGKISERYGDRVYSRLKEECKFLLIDGKDFRLK